MGKCPTHQSYLHDQHLQSHALISEEWLYPCDVYTALSSCNYVRALCWYVPSYYNFSCLVAFICSDTSQGWCLIFHKVSLSLVRTNLMLNRVTGREYFIGFTHLMFYGAAITQKMKAIQVEALRYITIFSYSSRRDCPSNSPWCPSCMAVRSWRWQLGCDYWMQGWRPISLKVSLSLVRTNLMLNKVTGSEYFQNSVHLMIYESTPSGSPEIHHRWS